MWEYREPGTPASREGPGSLAFAQKVFSDMDRDSSGDVDFEEFCAMMQERFIATPTQAGIGP